MKSFQVACLFLAAVVAQSYGMAVPDEDKIETVTDANFTVISTLPKGRSIGARNTLVISNFAATWDQAIAYCYSTQSVLVSISDHLIDASIRQGLVSQGLLNVPLWTSGRFAYTGEPLHLNTYMWVGNGRQMVYSNWDVIYSHPKTDWEFNTCVLTVAKTYMEAAYVWQTDNCAIAKRFICLR